MDRYRFGFKVNVFDLMIEARQIETCLLFHVVDEISLAGALKARGDGM